MVRGAYHPHEVAAHTSHLAHKPSLSISPDTQAPVWMTKSETDACYNACARMLVGTIKEDLTMRRPKGAPLTPAVGVLFGTHNWDSCDLILNELLSSGLAFKGPGDTDPVTLPDDVTERVTIGQLYGQSRVSFVADVGSLTINVLKGMSDELTNYLVKRTVSNTPLIIKYVYIFTIYFNRP